MLGSILGAAATDSATAATSAFTLGSLVICIVAALALGVVVALSYMYKNRYSASFVLTLAILLAVVCVFIMMVNGNVGAGVAVAGAFSLVRFRSAPGEILSSSFWQCVLALFVAWATSSLQPW